MQGLWRAGIAGRWEHGEGLTGSLAGLVQKTQERLLQVHTVVSTNCLSAGEALRVLDQKDLVKSDFVLVTGGVCHGGLVFGAIVERCRAVIGPLIADMHG